jgi:hypothetical protein
MADYYTITGNPGNKSNLASAPIRAEFAAIAAGLAKVAPYTGHGGEVVRINAGATGQESVPFSTLLATITSLAIAGTLTGVTDLTTTGNTILGNATTDTLNVGAGGIVKDASGNVSMAGTLTVTGGLAGNASTATALQTARTINGVSFNGTANITVPADAGTLTGATLAAGVTASSLTSFGTVTALNMSGAISGVTNLTTTGNTVLGNAQTDTLNIGNGDIIKDASGNVGIGATPGGFKIRTEFSGASVNGLLVSDTVSGGSPALLQVAKNSANVLTLTATGGAGRLDLTSPAGQAFAIRLAGNGGAVGSASLDFQQDSVGNADIVQRANARLSLYTNSVERLRVESDGRIFATAIHNSAGAVTGATNQYIASGTWTPTLTNSTNISASTPKEGKWIRVGNVVHCAVQLDIDPTSASAFSQIRISLPIASNMTASTDLSGTATPSAGPANVMVGGCVGDSATDTCVMTFYCGADATNVSWVATFSYEVK